jgi:hypothetical protein
LKNQLTQLLEVWTTSDKVIWDPYYNTGITKDNYRERWMDDDALGKIFANYGNQFIAMAKDFMGKKEYALRVKLVRQSKLKHYATIPGKFLADNPWVESMDVPADKSKLKFSKWEKENGFDNGTPVARAEADPAADVPAADAPTAGNVFGSR